MTLKRNAKYELILVYNGKDNGRDSKHSPIRHKQFEMKGKFNFDALEDLKKYGWKRLHPRLSEHRTDPEETLVYANSRAVTIIYANYETDYHQIDVSLKGPCDKDAQYFEDIKLMIEKNLKSKLEEMTELVVNPLNKN